MFSMTMIYFQLVRLDFVTRDSAVWTVRSTNRISWILANEYSGLFILAAFTSWNLGYSISHKNNNSYLPTDKLERITVVEEAFCGWQFFEGMGVNVYQDIFLWSPQMFLWSFLPMKGTFLACLTRNVL